MSSNQLLHQLLKTVNNLPDWTLLREAVESHRAVHLAIMTEPYLTYLLNGKKTIESRFSKNAVAPFAAVKTGDLVLLKASGGPIVGCFTARKVEFVELDASELARLKENYSKPICADDTFWSERQNKRYATLIGVRNVRRLSPASVAKSDRRGWVVLSATT